MRKKNIILFFFSLWLVLCPAAATAYTGGICYGFQLPDLGFANCLLYCHHIGTYSYTLSPGKQRFGWFLRGIISTIEPVEQVFGSLTGGVLLGQELRLGPVYLAATALAGLGLSTSNLGSTAGHLDLSGEARVELGFYIADWMQTGLYLGLQGFGNLLPGIPFQEYAFYTPALGLTVSWQGEEQVLEE